MIPEPDRADAFVTAAPAAVGNAGAPALRLGAWEGPLDLLLDLARAQRVDLARLSIATLAEQFAAAVDSAIARRRRVPLARPAELHITGPPATAPVGVGGADTDAPAARGDAAGLGEAFLPAGVGQGTTARLQLRAALARTLIAGHELSHERAALLDLDKAIGGIVVLPTKSVQGATAA
jgi:hypothetical protein